MPKQLCAGQPLLQLITIPIDSEDPYIYLPVWPKEIRFLACLEHLLACMAHDKNLVGFGLCAIAKRCRNHRYVVWKKIFNSDRRQVCGDSLLILYLCRLGTIGLHRLHGPGSKYPKERHRTILDTCSYVQSNSFESLIEQSWKKQIGNCASVYITDLGEPIFCADPCVTERNKLVNDPFVEVCNP